MIGGQGRVTRVVTPFRVVIAVAFLGSSAIIAYAILKVRDTTQIPMLSSGFAVLGLSLAAIALAAVIGLWRAASDGDNRRALLLGLGGGIVGLAAIGCLTATVLLALLWKTS